MMITHESKHAAVTSPPQGGVSFLGLIGPSLKGNGSSGLDKEGGGVGETATYE
jgi:hypothetical protein